MERSSSSDSTLMSARKAEADRTQHIDRDPDLEAGIARVLSPAETVEDPIFAVIAENRRLYAAWVATNALPEVPDTIDRPPEADTASDAFSAHCNDVLTKTVPTSVAGCKALAAYAVEFFRREEYPLDERAQGTAHLRILDLIARSPVAGDLSVAPVPDPIFAMIDEAWRLIRENARLFAICDNKADHHRSWKPQRKAHDAMWEYIRGVLLKTVPTTAEGCRALARFTLDFNKDQGVPVEYDSNDPVLDLIARSPLLEGGTTVRDAAPHASAAAWGA